MTYTACFLGGSRDGDDVVYPGDVPPETILMPLFSGVRFLPVTTKVLSPMDLASSTESYERTQLLAPSVWLYECGEEVPEEPERPSAWSMELEFKVVPGSASEELMRLMWGPDWQQPTPLPPEEFRPRFNGDMGAWS